MALPGTRNESEFEESRERIAESLRRFEATALDEIIGSIGPRDALVVQLLRNGATPVADMILPCFGSAQFPVEGAIVGRLVVGYGELEVEMMALVQAATRN